MKSVKKTVFTFLISSVLLLQLTAGVSVSAYEADWSKIPPELRVQMIENQTQKHEVIIWLNDDIDAIFSQRDFSNKTQKEKRTEKRKAVRENAKKVNQSFISSWMDTTDIVYVSEGSPIIIAKLYTKQIEELSKRNEVHAIYYCSSVVIEPCLVNAQDTIANNTASAKYDYTGAGVKIGIMEREYVESNLFPDVDVTLAGTPPTNPTISNVEHANNVLSVIASVAPEAEYYSTRVNHSSSVTETVASIMSCLNYLVSENIDVDIINMSMSANYSNTLGNSRDFFADLFDYYISNSDVVFVTSAGNVALNDTDHDLRGVTMSYNAIVVGAINDHNTPELEDDSWAYFSRYNSSSNTPYKPDIVAPGQNIWFPMYAENNSGTSFSAPWVTGGIALAMQANPDLKGNVSAVKALLSACVSPNSPHRYVVSDTEYRKMGAGLMDINEMIYANSQIIGGVVSSEQISVSGVFNCPKANMKVRLALSYLLDSESYYESPEYVDLDIVVYDPTYTVVANASTNYVNMEIVEFTAPIAGSYCVCVYTTSSTQEIEFSVAYQIVCVNHSLSPYLYENSLQHMRSCQNCAHVELAEHDYVEMASGGWRCSICRHISNSIIKSRTTHYNNICK